MTDAVEFMQWSSADQDSNLLAAMRIVRVRAEATSAYFRGQAQI
jgi:hypothetical protein